MKLLTTIVILFLAIPSFASTYLNWGMAFDYPWPEEYSDVQNYAIGHHGILSKKFDYIIEGGGWKDSSHYPGAEASLYGAAAIGIDLKLHERYVSYYVGPSVISKRDVVLGSNFEVYQKVSIGWRDERDERIGFFVKHFSDGGLSKVNYGRNFVGAEVSF